MKTTIDYLFNVPTVGSLFGRLSSNSIFWNLFLVVRKEKVPAKQISWIKREQWKTLPKLCFCNRDGSAVFGNRDGSAVSRELVFLYG